MKDYIPDMISNKCMIRQIDKWTVRRKAGRAAKALRDFSFFEPLWICL